MIHHEESVCGRDVTVTIDGKKLLQVRKAEVRKTAQLHRIRTCFSSEDVAVVRKNCRYKVFLEGIRFKKPFHNCNFADLDGFTLSFEADGSTILLSGCIWDDFLAAADQEQFSEHISATALNMTTIHQDKAD